MPGNLQYPPPKSGEPPLHRAARLGVLAEIRRAVEAGARVDEAFDLSLDPGASPCLATPLMVAAGSGDGANLETVELLLELGADPRLELDGRTALSFACRGLGWNYEPGGDVARLQRLLAAGAPLPTSRSQSHRMLCEVARRGDLDRLEVLLVLGLDPNGAWDPQEARAAASAFESQFGGELPEELDPFAELPDEMRAELKAASAEIARQQAERQATAPFSFEIPLHAAAESGNSACVRRLLAAGADVGRRDSTGRTAMYYAESLEAVQTLVAAGASLEDADHFEWGPLCAAVHDGWSARTRIEALLAAGANPNATHDQGYTVFMSAASSSERDPRLLPLLVAAGADPRAVSNLGYNAFHAAIDVNGEANSPESVEGVLSALRDLGVDLEQRNAAGQTPLARALWHGTVTEVAALCALGADPNAICPLYEGHGAERSVQSLPLVFHASWQCDVEKLETLLAAGADPIRRDGEGFRPLERVVAALCASADDFPGTFRQFFVEIAALPDWHDWQTSERDEFLAAARPALTRFVAEFAERHVPEDDTPSDERWRARQVDTIVTLTVYQAWAERELE